MFGGGPFGPQNPRDNWVVGYDGRYVNTSTGQSLPYGVSPAQLAIDRMLRTGGQPPPYNPETRRVAADAGYVPFFLTEQGGNLPGAARVSSTRPEQFLASGVARGDYGNTSMGAGLTDPWREDIYDRAPDRLVYSQQQQQQPQQQPQQDGGFFSGLGSLGKLAMAGIPAYMLGKMAYDETKRDRGVPLTPLTTMGPTGRYNIEAEIARRMGTQSPNPIEYGLLPRGTIPTLSGGQPMNAAHGGAVYPMAYAEGGDVSIDEFNKMNGAIEGEGTETSDTIPAMLSDGEFVMTGEAVRGAGRYNLNNQAGILTLIPSGATPDREGGTNLMYQMMDLFSDYVDDSRSVANA
jgi:hypothetical protein